MRRPGKCATSGLDPVMLLMNVKASVTATLRLALGPESTANRSFGVYICEIKTAVRNTMKRVCLYLRLKVQGKQI